MFLEKLQINIESQSSTEDHMELDGNLRTDDDLSWIVALLPNRFSDGCRVEVELDFSEISAPEKTLRLPVWEEIDKKLINLITVGGIRTLECWAPRGLSVDDTCTTLEDCLPMVSKSSGQEFNFFVREDSEEE